MNQTFALHRIVATVLCSSMAALSGQQIDLTGHVVDIRETGITNAVARLMAANISDTTDSSGDFHLVGNTSSLAEAAGKDDNPFFTIEGNRIVFPRSIRTAAIELFDISGKKINTAAYNGGGSANRRIGLLTMIPHRTSSLYLIRVDDGLHRMVRTIVAPGSASPGTTTSTQPAVLAKRSAASDTLVITKDGFAGKKMHITDFQKNLGTIQLLQEEDTFVIRVPEERTIQCRDEISGNLVDQQFWDVDYLCDCHNDSFQATIYVQARPDSCILRFAAYSVNAAWIKINGKIQPLPSASYNWGGNHHNDRLTFTYNGRIYSLYHASFGWGWRACAEPDCMQLCEDDQCRAIKTDGCGRQVCSDRPALKVTCVQVQNDGSVPPLLDPWVAQTGRDTYPLLPCRGDSRCQ